jgi:primosomal protein N' (replication factor Y)
LWADANLSFPIYNASEVALQQIIQVAGRAGRQGQKSLVIVQTIKNHEIFNYINEHDYEAFYEQEIEKRIAVKYPPCIRLAEIEVKNQEESVLENEIKILKQELNAIIKKLGIKITLMGPVDAVVQKIKNLCIKKFYLKSENSNHLNLVYNHIDRSKYSSTIYFTPNPLS